MVALAANPQIEKLKETRREIAVAIRKLVEDSENADRAFSDDESLKFKELRGLIKGGDERIERLEEMDKLAPPAEAIEQENELKHKLAKRSHDANNDDPDRPLTQPERCMALRGWLAGRFSYQGQEHDLVLAKRAGLNVGGLELNLDRFRGHDPSGTEYRAPKSVAEARTQADARRNMTPEQRATNIVGTTTLGGFTVPDEVMRPLEDALLFFGGMRQVAEIASTSTGADWPIPTANDTTIKGEIILEDAATNVQEIIFGQVVLKAFKYSSKQVQISVELLQDSATNMAVYIGQKLGERIGRITNEHFTTGAGTTLPFGIVTDAVDSGVTTASNTVYVFTELLALKHSVDIAYRNMGALWMFHDDTAEIISAMADSQGRPLWLPSVRDGMPDVILGHAFQINNDMPSGAAAKTVLFGAFSKYLIRDVLGIQMLRLDERFAEFHRVAFLAFSRQDGKLIDAGTAPVKFLTSAV